jgi:1-acyl-sn-glycerol-3-phosphate acyltransferase
MTLFRRIWRTLFFINFCITLLLLYPLFALLLSRKEWYGHAHQLKRFWAKLITLNVGITCEVTYTTPLNPNQTYVICPNHASYLDVVITYIAIPNYFHYLAKDELAKVPLFGIFFRKMDIAFDRKSIKAAQKAFDRAAADIKAGISIAMFPEGTISGEAPQMARFKNGPFKLAIESQTPILPVTFVNNWLILPDGDTGRLGGPGKGLVIVHEPVPTTGLTHNDLEDLKKRVFEIINKPLLTHANRP